MAEPAIHATYPFQGEHGIESRTFVGSMRAFALFLQRKGQELPQDVEGLLRGPPYLCQRNRVRVILNEGTVKDVPRMVTWLASSPRPGTEAPARFSIDKLEFEGNRIDHRYVVALSQIPSFLGHLLSLGFVTSLNLCTIWWPDQCCQIFQSVSENSETLQELVVTLFNFQLGQFDMSPAYWALAEAIPRMRSLDQFHLLEGCLVDPYNSHSILHAALNPETGPPRLSLLHLTGLHLTGPESLSLEGLASNRYLEDLQLHGSFSQQTIWVLASALKTNDTLQRLDLWNTAEDNFEYAAFGEAMAVNQSLVFLALGRPHFPDTDVFCLSIGLRHNKTLKSLLLDGWSGLNREGLQPLIEAVQHDNHTIERVRIPSHLRSEQALLDSVCTFRGPFRSACQAFVGQGTGATSDARAAAFHRWWPLLGSTHAKIKATVLYCLLRSRAEVASQSLQPASASSTRKGSADDALTTDAGGGGDLLPPRQDLTGDAGAESLQK